MKLRMARKSPHYLILLLFMSLALTALACTAAGMSADTANDAEEPADDTDSQEADEPEGDESEEEAEEPEAEPAPEDESECPFSGEFASDVTIPDGTVLAPGTPFDKTWIIENDGCQDWTNGTILVFDHGDRMDSPDFVVIPNAPAGGTSEVTVPLTAPTAAGTYTGYWQCQSPDGVRFCQIYAQIVVPQPTPTPEPTSTPIPTVTETVASHPSPSLTGQVLSTDCAANLRVGYTPTGPVRSGISFDVSPYHGLTITSASLILSDYTQDGAPFDNLGPLNVRLAEFGEICFAYDVSADPVIATVGSMAGLDVPVDVTEALNTLVNAPSPLCFFQVKLNFDDDETGGPFDGVIRWTSVTLVVEYIP